MIRKGYKNKDLAQAMGICVAALYHKMSGDTDFTLSEAITIKKTLGYKGKLETLFAKTEGEET